METVTSSISQITNKIPKWFWISLGLIIVATIIAMMYTNYKTRVLSDDLKTNIANVKDTVENGPLSEPVKVLIKDEVKKNVVELFPDLTSALKVA